MKRGLKVLLFSDALTNLALGMIGPIYAIFVENIGGDILDASWAYSVYLLTAGVVMYLISRWEDRFRHKEKLICIGYTITTIGCLSYFFVYNQASLLITQAILGLSMAILSPAFDAIYSHYIIKREEASDWGIWEAMSYIVTAIAAVIGGYTADLFGFKILFIAMFVVSFIGTIASLTLLRTKKYLNSSRN